MRRIIDLNDGWRRVPAAKSFADAAARVEADGESVSLPRIGSGAQGCGWYLLQLSGQLSKLQAGSGECIWLEFDGVGPVAEVFADGIRLLRHEGAGSRFRVELTGFITDGACPLLAVAVSDDAFYPNSREFPAFSGFGGGVRLLALPQAHFSMEYMGSTGIKVQTALHEDSAEVTVELWAQGPAKSAEVFLEEKSERVRFRAGYAQEVFTLSSPHLWQGVRDPYLYTVTARMDSGDEVSTRFGIRSMALDAGRGFLLNGKPYPLHGLCCQPVAGSGAALHLTGRQELLALRSLGANALRLQWLQFSQQVYDACDELGLVVWTEIPFAETHIPTGYYTIFSQLLEQIVQNASHPCIACWGISHGIGAAALTSPLVLHEHWLLNSLCHTRDAGRSTVISHSACIQDEDPLLEIGDTNCFDIRCAAPAALQRELEKLELYHRRYPGSSVGVSCYGGTQPRHLLRLHEMMLAAQKTRPWLWGAFGADVQPCAEEQPSADALQRDLHALYRAHWTAEPMVHICGGDVQQSQTPQTELTVYTNRPEAALYMDGRLIALQGGTPVLRFSLQLTGVHTVEVRTSCCNAVCRLVYTAARSAG